MLCFINISFARCKFKSVDVRHLSLNIDLQCCRVCFVFDKLMMITRSAYERYYFEFFLLMDKYNLGTVCTEKLSLPHKKSLLSQGLKQVYAKVSGWLDEVVFSYLVLLWVQTVVFPN